MDPRCRRAVGLARVENESVDVLETQRSKISGPGVETVAEKGSNGRPVSLYRVQACAALAKEEALIPVYGVPDRVIARRFRQGVDLELILSFIYKRSIFLNLSIPKNMGSSPYMTLCQEGRGR